MKVSYRRLATIRSNPPPSSAAIRPLQHRLGQPTLSSFSSFQVGSSSQSQMKMFTRSMSSEKQRNMSSQAVAAATTQPPESLSSASSSTRDETFQSSRSPKPPSSSSSTTPSIQLSSTSTLLRSYFVYTLCSFPTIIDYSPTLLRMLTNSPIPGLKWLTELGVRHTFFAQFVPGETASECTVTMKELRDRGVGSVLNYSAEAEEEVASALSVPVSHSDSPLSPPTSPNGLKGLEGLGGQADLTVAGGGVDGHIGSSGRIAPTTPSAAKLLEQQRLEEVKRALEASGVFEEEMESKGGARGSTGFALKITGLIDPLILQRASTSILRLRYAQKQQNSKVPYPGTPVTLDGSVLASAPGTDVKHLFDLKGSVPGMGVLETDEGVRAEDVTALYELWGQLKALCDHAKQHGVRIFVDAEHTWYQPALDGYTLLLSEVYNKPPKDGKWSGPLIYGTYQCYLRRELTHLPEAIKHAEDNGYALGLKVVRGAYFMQERKKWKDEGREGVDPICSDKHTTDNSYNDSVKIILSTMAKQLDSRPSHALAVVFGTHNPESVDLIIEGLKENGLASEIAGGRLRLRQDVKGKIGIAQLYGMKDDLMDKIVSTFEPSNQPVSLKYIAYGKLSEVIPFLGRRAIENKSLMSGEGGAAAEKARIWAELSRRYFGTQETATA